MKKRADRKLAAERVGMQEPLLSERQLEFTQKSFRMPTVGPAPMFENVLEVNKVVWVRFG